MTLAGIILLALLQSKLDQVLPDANQVVVIDGGKSSSQAPTAFDAGPSTGDVLNNHFFPSVVGYNTGRYNYALSELNYILRRPNYLDVNPRKGEFLSTASYLRGMIYFYHANGIGRHERAKADFEAAIRWNPANYVAYFELSRVYADLGYKEQASSIIKHLLELKPPKDTADEAAKELKKLVETDLH